MDIATGLPSYLYDLDESQAPSLLKDGIQSINGLSDDLSLIHDMEMNVIKIGANDVDAFVGFGGPYFIDSDLDGIIYKNDTSSEDDSGFVFENMDLGIEIFDPVLQDQAEYDWLPGFFAGKGLSDTFLVISSCQKVNKMFVYFYNYL